MDLRPTLEFLLYDWLRAGDLTPRGRFAERSRETFDAEFSTCAGVSQEAF